ncbi:MAG TPA: GIY-YIG nuclease family protein [Solirubrobacteraceae bacterium]|jgi:predicted GIY-YIG superfamily endonuclease
MVTRAVPEFQAAVEQMPSLLADLRLAPSHRVADHPRIPASPGIYLFSQRDRPVYVGQSRNLRTRLRQHTWERSRENAASFAFNIAKRDAVAAGVDIKRWRRVLEADPAFIPHFVDARASVAAMTVQFIELADPVVRTLFEVYVALALRLDEFNSFETH